MKKVLYISYMFSDCYYQNKHFPFANFHACMVKTVVDGTKNLLRTCWPIIRYGKLPHHYGTRLVVQQTNREQFIITNVINVVRRLGGQDWTLRQAYWGNNVMHPICSLDVPAYVHQYLSQCGCFVMTLCHEQRTTRRNGHNDAGGPTV